MPFCTKCGKQLDDSALFCSACGAPVKQAMNQPIREQSKDTQKFGGSSVVFRYEKSALFVALTEPLSVNLDGQLNFSVVSGREICYNVAQGNHTLNAYVPYMAGSKYGQVTKNFFVGNNETWEITYKPPMAVFMTGNISIRRIG